MAPPRFRRPDVLPAFFYALSCSPRRAGHCGGFIFVWRGRERDSGELRGAHLIGGNGATVVGLGSGERPASLLPEPSDRIPTARITYPFGVM